MSNEESSQVDQSEVVQSELTQTPVELTKYTTFSGCGAKIGPGLLDKALCGLTQPENDRVLSDFSHSEDAGIMRLTEDLAVVQTLDFFPPIVDDPYQFGRIAAANALSDLYAMGATPLSALSIVCFPTETLEMDTLRSMMEGGISAIQEAGASLIGGHSIRDEGVKLGFSVTGTIHPQMILRNNTPKMGDSLVLTKPIGTGTINRAFRAGVASEESVAASLESMMKLNKIAAEVASKHQVSACTDVTGFGLGGHCAEMVADTSCGLVLRKESIKLLPHAFEYISQGYVPGGTKNNRDFREKFIYNKEDLSEDELNLLFDPQTSGGLLLTLRPRHAKKYVEDLQELGIDACIIGEVTDRFGTITFE